VARPQGTDAAWSAAATALEESRIEARQVARRPADRAWLRACTAQIVVRDFAAAAAPPASAAEAGSAAALILAREDAGIIETAEAEPVAKAVAPAIGEGKLGQLRQVWREAHATADDDARGMVRLGRRWCRILGVQPDQAAPKAEFAPPPPFSPGQAEAREAENNARRQAGDAACDVSGSMSAFTGPTSPKARSRQSRHRHEPCALPRILLKVEAGMDLNQLVGLMHEQVPSYAEEITAQVWGVLGYDEEHMSRADLADRVQPSLRLILRLMLQSDASAGDALQHAAAIGEARALQGVPVEALLYSWTAAQRLLLLKILDHAGELSASDLRDATTRLMAGIELLTWHSIESYRQTQDAVSTSYEGSTADLVAALAGPEPPDAAETARRALLVSARVDMPYTAVAVGSRYGLPGLLPAQRHIHRTLRVQLRDRVLVGQVQQFALMLVPTAQGTDRIEQLLQRALDDEVGPPGTLIGRGETAPSLAEVGSSIRQSSQAVEVAGRLRRYDQVVSFLDVIPEVLLLRNPELVESLIASRLGPLQGRPELLGTLSAFLRNRLSVRRTAAALTTHPNTVVYRLKRLRETLGRDFDDVEGIVDLVLALRAAELTSAEDDTGPVSRAAR
jgi:hypothetical protein